LKARHLKGTADGRPYGAGYGTLLAMITNKSGAKMNLAADFTTPRKYHRKMPRTGSVSVAGCCWLLLPRVNL